MIEGKITNIVLVKGQFQVFAIIDGNQESNTFLPVVTAPEILTWLDERVAYYTELREKEILLQSELLD